MWIILSAFVIQCIFLVSVFDIHFHSPVVHGMTAYSSKHPAPAKRLVLISADGLRFDTFLSYGLDTRPNAPFLRSVAGSRGKWGLSNTRVPTESRPGHVAMIAGLYEDPSAVFKGWKENPVEFDSIFNESRYSFGWGSPDILSLFNKGEKNNVFFNAYASENEDFTGYEAYKLDEWVFEHFERFIKVVPHNETLKNMVDDSGVVFFFHLLGLDTNGHSNKPHSEYYVDNLRYVDQGIAKLEKLLNDYFKDNKTAFVFTSDHGMTDWGSHGAGHPSETRTPIVVWGAGVETKNIDADNWEKQQIDIEQADIAPLMASLLGINFPINSVGKLPLEFLADDMMMKSQAALANAQQLRASFEAVYTRQKERILSWRFHAFQPLEPRLGLTFIEEINSSINIGLYKESISKSIQLMSLCLQGTEFYHRYDQFQLKTCITIAYLGWASVLIVFLVQERIKHGANFSRAAKKQPKFRLIDRILFPISILVFVILTVEKASVLYYMYHLLPLLLWWYTLRQSSLFHRIKWHKRYFVWIAALIIGIQVLVAGFFYRSFLSVGLCFLGLWPHWTPVSRSSHHENLKFLWTILCVVLALFPMFPPVGNHSLPMLVDIGGMVLTVVAFWSSLVMHHDRDRTILVCYTLAIPVTLYIRHSVSDNLLQGNGLPLMEQCFSWTLLCLPLTLPVMGPSKMWPRLIGIAVCLTPSFLLLSQSYEVLFYILLIVVLGVWIKLEAAIQPSPWHLLRRSYFFLFLTLLSFFGTGNLASLNSFDPSCLRTFVTTFSPYTMGALLIWKITVPFIAVSTALWAITVENQISMRAIYLMILLLSSAMAVQFFHWVTSIGSWLDIGTSLSHYVIVQLAIIFVMVLRSLVQLLTHGPMYCRGSSKYFTD